LHHRHEAVVHVQLLVAVKKCRAGIVRRKIHLDLLPGGHDDYVFHDAFRCFAGESGQLEGVPVQVDRVCFIALVIEAKAVPSIGTDSNGIGLRERFTVDGPVIHPAVAGEFLAEDERHNAARWLWSLRFAPKNRVVPRSVRRRGPLRRFAAVRIFHDDTQPALRT
jgi:hypothetical protein